MGHFWICSPFKYLLSAKVKKLYKPKKQVLCERPSNREGGAAITKGSSSSYVSLYQIPIFMKAVASRSVRRSHQLKSVTDTRCPAKQIKIKVSKRILHVLQISAFLQISPDILLE